MVITKGASSSSAKGKGQERNSSLSRQVNQAATSASPPVNKAPAVRYPDAPPPAPPKYGEQPQRREMPYQGTQNYRPRPQPQAQDSPSVTHNQPVNRTIISPLLPDPMMSRNPSSAMAYGFARQMEGLEERLKQEINVLREWAIRARRIELQPGQAQTLLLSEANNFGKLVDELAVLRAKWSMLGGSADWRKAS